MQIKKAIKETLKKNKAFMKIYSRANHCYFCFLTILSPTLNTKARYKEAFKKPLDLDNPQSYSEKLLKLKLDSYETNPLVRQCADKYAVRRYIEEKGCPEILVPLIAAYDKPEDIDWDALPDQFAMKWNFGCGFNIICDDKSKLDREAAVRKLKKWSKVKTHLSHSEMQYKNVPKKIIVEQYLKPKQGKLPEDYKLYCFGGKAMYVMICVGREFGHPKFLYYDRDFNFLRNFSSSGMSMPEDFQMEKPEGYDDLFRYADILSAPFPTVRADFYLLNGKVYFGELTFTPAGCVDAKKMPEVEKLFGELIPMP